MSDPLVVAWITLLDSAETLRRTAPSRDPGAMDRVGKAIDLLLAHEHSLTPAQRELARRTVWLRDHPDEPLPADRSRWGDCVCPRCALDRRLARLRQTYSALTRAADISQPNQPQPEQGEMLI